MIKEITFNSQNKQKSQRKHILKTNNKIITYLNPYYITLSILFAPYPLIGVRNILAQKDKNKLENRDFAFGPPM